MVTKLSFNGRVCVARSVYRARVQLEGSFLERADHGASGHPPQVTLQWVGAIQQGGYRMIYFIVREESDMVLYVLSA